MTIILGIIEGITEFFPISSTCHIMIFAKIFRIEANEAKTLNLFMQLGTSLSILLYFKNTFITLFYSLLKTEKKYTCNNHLSYHHILLSIFPIALLGLYFHKYMKFIFNPQNILLSIICGSILLMLSEILKTRIQYKNTNINLIKSFTIGCFQCLALLPGFSRSCSTISIGILIGLNQRAATYFSFIISVPIFFGAMILDIIYDIPTISRSNMCFLIIGFLSAFITSKLCIRKCLKIVSTGSFTPFIIYRLILSIIIYVFFYH
ncbi:MAG: undecaprenyl-diphosphate phosphatase [Buchnera aphidicola (Kaburagia rhusicola rhusicola)]